MSSISINRAPVNALPSVVQAVVTTEQVFPRLDAASLPLVLTAPSGGILEQKKFTVRASGKVVTGVTTNVTVKLYGSITAPTIAAPGTLIAQSTARAVNSSSCPWFIEAVELVFDSTSGKLHGLQKAMVNNLVDAEAAIANAVTSVLGRVGDPEPALYFAVSITFSASNAGNIATCSDFVLDE